MELIPNCSEITSKVHIHIFFKYMLLLIKNKTNKSCSCKNDLLTAYINVKIAYYNSFTHHYYNYKNMWHICMYV